ncbi:MAG: DNA mismatch repair endonuclease MutL [Planctomycetota bacterium]
MARIRILPPGLINRIAAGECVERPASVVKELMENALDAGAETIDVNILDGGRGMIQVIDDGAGMDPEDLELAVTPHATSKIQTDEDLFNIHTMGFRGEALASIGSVSRLQITTRLRTTDVGTSIRVEAGQVGKPTPCAAAPGTSVAVRDLFFNVPVRRKFLRTNQTEMGHVTEQFARIALAHPSVAFNLKHQERVFHRLQSATGRQQRIADFYGPEIAETLLLIQRAGGGVRVEGYAAPPAQCRRSSKWEYIFVNGRYVRDRFVSHAVKEAYRSLLQPDQRPLVFLFITIDPAQVDVNVHPTKAEVRWRDSNYMHGQVLSAFRDKFLATNLDRPLRPPPAEGDVYRQRVRQAMVDFFTSARPADGGEAAPTASTATRAPVSDHAGVLETVPPTRALEAHNTGLPTDHDITPPQAAATSQVSSELSPVKPETIPLPLLNRAIQIHNSYLVVETDEGLMIIDQHALHERILYEELKQRITSRPLESQRTLLPELVRVPPDRIEVLETHAETLSKLGLLLVATGPQTVSLQAFPLLLERLRPHEFVRDLLDLLSEHGQRPNTESMVHDVLDMMACKATVKAGDPLTPTEIDALLARRQLAERASHCPHGRPTTLHLTLRDLERQFKRS